MRERTHRLRAGRQAEHPETECLREGGQELEVKEVIARTQVFDSLKGGAIQKMSRARQKLCRGSFS